MGCDAAAIAAAIAHWATGFPRLRWSEWRPIALGILQRLEASAPPPGPDKKIAKNGHNFLRG